MKIKQRCRRNHIGRNGYLENRRLQDNSTTSLIAMPFSLGFGYQIFRIVLKCGVAADFVFL